MRFLAFAVALSIAASAEAADDLLIRNVRLVSPETGAVTSRAWLRIADGVVAETGKGRVRPRPSERAIDGAGRYLVPGLIDSHVHVWGDAGVREDRLAADPGLLEAFRAQEPKSFLRFGFTTLVDLKKSQATVDRWNAQSIAPALFACRDAPFADGYGMGFEPAETRFERPYYYYDPEQPDSIPADADPAAHTPEAVVAAIAADGDAICLKTFYEPGFSGLFDFAVPSLALETRMANAAHAAGLLHVFHATSLEAWRIGAAAGVDVMAHGLWHWDALAPRGVERLPEDIETLADAMIAQGTAFQLTARILGGEIDQYREEFLDDPRLVDALPPSLLAYFKGPDGAWFRDALERRIAGAPGLLERFLGRAPTGEKAETSKTALVRLTLLAHYIREKNGLILFGSDTPSSPGPTNPPGLNGRLEMDALAAMGFSPAAILKAATTDNARIFGLQGRGCLNAGCRGDALLLSDNPLQSVAAYDAIDLVILGGRPLDPAALSARNAPQ
ncbi:MAG: hypothetical protein RIA10_06470 [Amphiplicatus sp.]